MGLFLLNKEGIQSGIVRGGSPCRIVLAEHDVGLDFGHVVAHYRLGWRGCLTLVHSRLARYELLSEMVSFSCQLLDLLRELIDLLL